MTQFSTSRVLPITFPLELIEISPTLEIAKLEECALIWGPCCPHKGEILLKNESKKEISETER